MPPGMQALPPTFAAPLHGLLHSLGRMQTVQHPLTLLLFRSTTFMHSLGGVQAATLPPTFCCPAARSSCTRWAAWRHTPTNLRCPAAWPPALAGWNADRAESHSNLSAVPQHDLHALAGRRAGSHTPTNLLLPMQAVQNHTLNLLLSRCRNMIVVERSYLSF